MSLAVSFFTPIFFMYNAAVDWEGVSAFLQRLIHPVLKAGNVKVQLIVCSDDSERAVAAVRDCLNEGALKDWSKQEGSIVNAAQLCSSREGRIACVHCSAFPPHHLDFALLTRCHWALVSNSTFGTAARMSDLPNHQPRALTK